MATTDERTSDGEPPTSGSESSDARASIARTVRQILLATLELELPLESLSDETVIFEGDLGADSVQAVELITRLEEEFDIAFEDEELSAEMLETVGTLTDAVWNKHRESPV